MEKMQSDPELAAILRALQETNKEDIVQEERQRRQQARQSRLEGDLTAMEVDQAGVRCCHFLVAHSCIISVTVILFLFLSQFMSFPLYLICLPVPFT